MKICLIPARSNSKRIKNKNIKRFFGKPLISYSISTALKSKLFDKVVVSTDSKKIKKIALKCGAEVPFLRPKRLSNDFASDIDVINHYVKFIKKNEKFKIKKLCYLYPCSPLLKISTLKKCYNLLSNKRCEKVITVSKLSHPIERVLKKNKKNVYDFKDKRFFNTRSQDLKEYYQDAAQCYWYNLEKLNHLRKDRFIKSLAVILNKNEFYDIDNLEDFNFLKKLYAISNKKKFKF